MVYVLSKFVVAGTPASSAPTVPSWQTFCLADNFTSPEIIQDLSVQVPEADVPRVSLTLLIMTQPYSIKAKTYQGLSGHNVHRSHVAHRS